jgi:hypothetical protein
MEAVPSIGTAGVGKGDEVQRIQLDWFYFYLMYLYRVVIFLP